eukprot:12534905-Alexandrium_andersonii.AAC.1
MARLFCNRSINSHVCGLIQSLTGRLDTGAASDTTFLTASDNMARCVSGSTFHGIGGMSDRPIRTLSCTSGLSRRATSQTGLFLLCHGGLRAATN